MKPFIITIDGPSGTGKSTVAKTVARKLGFLFLDTGALYRTAALAVHEKQTDPGDDKICGEITAHADIDLQGDNVFLNSRDVTAAIRENHISQLSSRVAAHPSVRRALLDVQRNFGKRASLVAEGRDTGSVVFPEADVKIFLDALPEERAKRRHRELIAKGVEIPYQQVLTEIEERDCRDSQRAHAPLIAPEHAIVVDTTQLSLAEVIDKILLMVAKKLSDK